MTVDARAFRGGALAVDSEVLPRAKNIASIDTCTLHGEALTVDPYTLIGMAQTVDSARFSGNR